MARDNEKKRKRLPCSSPIPDKESMARFGGHSDPAAPASPSHSHNHNHDASEPAYSHPYKEWYNKSSLSPWSIERDSHMPWSGPTPSRPGIITPQDVACGRHVRKLRSALASATPGERIFLPCAPRTEFGEKTLTELKALCRSHGLGLSGAKSVLVERLKAWEDAHLGVYELGDETQTGKGKGNGKAKGRGPKPSGKARVLSTGEWAHGMGPLVIAVPGVELRGSNDGLVRIRLTDCPRASDTFGRGHGADRVGFGARDSFVVVVKAPGVSLANLALDGQADTLSVECPSCLAVEPIATCDMEAVQVTGTAHVGSRASARFKECAFSAEALRSDPSAASSMPGVHVDGKCFMEGCVVRGQPGVGVRVQSYARLCAVTTRVEDCGGHGICVSGQPWASNRSGKPSRAQVILEDCSLTGNAGFGLDGSNGPLFGVVGRLLTVGNASGEIHLDESRRDARYRGTLVAADVLDLGPGAAAASTRRHDGRGRTGSTGRTGAAADPDHDADTAAPIDIDAWVDVDRDLEARVTFALGPLFGAYG